MKYTEIIILLATFTLFSCGKKEIVTQSLCMSLVNKTEKRLLYAIETSEKNDTIVSTGLDSISVAFYRTTEIEQSLLGLDPFYPGVNVIRETLFNITDTSRYSYYRFTLPQNMSVEDNIFIRHQFLSGDVSNIKNGIEYSVLYFTDSIVNIMRKDFSMTEKFRAYYDGSHE
jgi:hypothetical protein